MATSSSSNASPASLGTLRARAVRLWVLLLLLGLATAPCWPIVARTGSLQSEGGSIAGRVQDERGTPIAQAVVTISSADFSAVAPTQADGKFEFKPLKPGHYRIVAEAARFRKERVNVTITRPDESLPPLVIKLSPSSLHVAVLDTSNLPLKGVTLTLSARGRSPAGGAAERTVTDESGDAYFGRLAPGSYLLSAALGGYDEYRNEVFISPGITTDLPIQLPVAPVIPINEKAVSRYNVPSLPSKNVQAILQDRDGWLWIGTDKGIARFNGSDFKSSSAPGSPYETLGGDNIRAIAEDGTGAIWLALSNGVRRINREGVDPVRLLEGVETRQIIVDSRDVVWVASSAGLFRFQDNSFTGFDQSRGLPSVDVKAVVEDKTGKIWIATTRGVATLDGDRFVRFSPPLAAERAVESGSSGEGETQREGEAGTRSRVGSQTDAAATPLADCRSIFVDYSGAIWFGTGRGVFWFDGLVLRPVSLTGGREPANTIKAAATDSGILAISQDGQERGGRIWFALESGGVVLYEPARGESQRINPLERDRATAIFACREGNVVFGTDNGAVNTDFYSFVNFTSSRGLSDNDVRAVVEGPGGVWFLTASGLSRMADERFARVERFPSNVNPRAVAFDTAGAAWFATRQGVLRLSGQTLTQLNEGNGLASNNVHWVGALGGGQRMIFGTSAGANVFENGNLRALDQLAGYDVRHVFEDSDGRLWISTSRGLVSLNLRTNETQVVDTSRGLADNDVRCSLRFDGRLLVATRSGTQIFEPDRRPSQFTPFDGDPASAMFVDRDGYLWIGADEGQVKKFGSAGGRVFSTLYSGDSMPFSGGRINSISESGSSIWIGTDRGAVRHIPARVSPSAQALFKVDDQIQTAGSEGFYVPYGRHKLTFSFAAASMTGWVRYLYRISSPGAEEPWDMLAVQQGGEREVSRFELDEGAYTFELMTLNRDLYGAATPTLTLPIRVGSPIWKRWWFYAAALALILMGATIAVAARRMRDREFVLPKELRSYVPIEPNPYIVGNPIRTEKMFFGREDDFRYIRTKLEGANQGVVIVFCGDRRVGKSSILYQVLNGRLGDSFIPVFVDMQEMVIASDSEFFARVSRLIVEAIARADGRGGATSSRSPIAGGVLAPAAAVLATERAPARPVFEVEPPQFDGRNPYPLFIDFFDEVLSAIGGRTLLVLIDEYELMEAKVDEGKLSPDLFTFLAGMMDNKERLAFIFTGSRRLEERDKKYWRELLRRSLFRKVGFLSEKDAVRLITEPVAGRVVYGRGAVEAICRLTAGQPFYTQVICQNVVDYMNEHEQNWITVAGLQQVIGEVVDNPLPQMIYTWDALSDDEKLALSLLAEILPEGYSYATAHQLRTSVRANEYPVNLSENTIRLTLEEMFRRELLEKDPADGFRFRIDLLRMWICRSHSIWQVVKEVRTL